MALRWAGGGRGRTCWVLIKEDTCPHDHLRRSMPKSRVGGLCLGFLAPGKTSLWGDAPCAVTAGTAWLCLSFLPGSGRGCRRLWGTSSSA